MVQFFFELAILNFFSLHPLPLLLMFNPAFYNKTYLYEFPNLKNDLIPKMEKFHHHKYFLDTK